MKWKWVKNEFWRTDQEKYGFMDKNLSIKKVIDGLEKFQKNPTINSAMHSISVQFC